MDVKRIRILKFTFIATDETEKYTDVGVILAELSGGTQLKQRIEGTRYILYS